MTDEKRSETWIGGVHNLRGFQHRGKAMRVAGWISSRGDVLDAAIVEAKGPAVLRQMLDALMKSQPAHELPTRLVVWPTARAAFRDLVYPPVTVERNLFLKIVFEDRADAGFFPGDLEVRKA